MDVAGEHQLDVSPGASSTDSTTEQHILTLMQAENYLKGLGRLCVSGEKEEMYKHTLTFVLYVAFRSADVYDGTGFTHTAIIHTASQN